MSTRNLVMAFFSGHGSSRACCCGATPVAAVAASLAGRGEWKQSKRGFGKWFIYSIRCSTTTRNPFLQLCDSILVRYLLTLSIYFLSIPKPILFRHLSWSTFGAVLWELLGRGHSLSEMGIVGINLKFIRLLPSLSWWHLVLCINMGNLSSLGVGSAYVRWELSVKSGCWVCICEMGARDGSYLFNNQRTNNAQTTQNPKFVFRN